jgi:hypothetical protein
MIDPRVKPGHSYIRNPTMKQYDLLKRMQAENIIRDLEFHGIYVGRDTAELATFQRTHDTVRAMSRDPDYDPIQEVRGAGTKTTSSQMDSALLKTIPIGATISMSSASRDAELIKDTADFFDSTKRTGPSHETILIWAFLAFIGTIAIGTIWKLA